jgi:branched-chain amino acid transport system ATP-binding protein
VRLGIARTFQGSRLFSRLSVAENVRAAAQLRHPTTMADAVLGTPRLRRNEAEVDAITRELLDLVDLTSRATMRASELPYGDQRRLEIARSLATDPQLLALDEPAAGMNPTEKRELREDIQRIRMRGVGILLIEHDMGLVQGICERVTVLDHGVKIAEGSFQEVRRHPAVLEAYLGRRHA